MGQLSGFTGRSTVQPCHGNGSARLTLQGFVHRVCTGQALDIGIAHGGNVVPHGDACFLCGRAIVNTGHLSVAGLVDAKFHADAQNLAALDVHQLGVGVGSVVAGEMCIRDSQSTGQTVTLPLREYLIGAVAAEMPVSWPDEALKAQAVAAHSYALYRRDHSTGENGAWFTADPARRQGCLTDAVLHSYWGTAYAANYARLSALVDAVQTQVLYYEDAPAGTSYFAMSNGRTEASENVWGTALPYLVPVDSSTDTAADNYEYTLNLSAAQLQQLLAERLGIAADLSQQAQWFGTPVLTSSGYVDSLPVCGQTVQGTTLRKALGLRSACFTVVCQSGTFSFTTRGYGHGVGMSQWGAKALAEQGADYRAILAHYYPGTELRG